MSDGHMLFGGSFGDLGDLFSKLTGMDRVQEDRLDDAVSKLDEFQATLDKEIESLKAAKESLKTMFTDGKLPSRDNGFLMGLFPATYTNVYSLLGNLISQYEEVHAKISEEILERSRTWETDKAGKRQLRMNAQRMIPHIYQNAAQVYLTSAHSLPKAVEFILETSKTANKYLSQRFVKKEEPDNPRTQRVMVVRDDDEERAPYVKIKLFQDNPALTESLLYMIEELIPRYRERIKKGKSGRRRTEKFVEQYSIDEAVDTLVDIADSDLLKYLEDSQKFFSTIGKAFEGYFTAFKALIPHHQKFPKPPVIGMDSDSIDDMVSPNILAETDRKISRLEKTSLDTITQREEDYAPNNRKETEHFKHRAKLMDLLYISISEIPEIEGDEKRREYAKGVVMEAIDIKAKMIEAIRPSNLRRLLHDQRADNEHYEGSQGAWGRFEFERRPTPDVRMEDVIGASFDAAKQHISEVVETGDYPLLMRLSAPGKKVRANMIMIGPYGCGKTELARAVCSDPRVIGATVSVTDTMTAFVHESVNNVRRVYDAARDLYISGREKKPVVLILDEFDGWFSGGEEGSYAAMDAQQIETSLSEILDGMRDYQGIITVAMTNKPGEIPKRIYRRFRYVDVVGQLTPEERGTLLKMYLERSLPTDSITEEHYSRWALMLEDAPGDVIRKVVDELHFSLIPEFLAKYPRQAKIIERTLQKREESYGTNRNQDTDYIKSRLKDFRVITPAAVESSIESLLAKSHIQRQIETARQVYEEAATILSEARGSGSGFGMQQKKDTFRNY